MYIVTIREPIQSLKCEIQRFLSWFKSKFQYKLSFEPSKTSFQEQVIQGRISFNIYAITK